MGDMRLTHQEQRAGFITGQTGEMCLKAIHQLDAATRTSNGEDRHAGFTERLDVAQDGSLRHLECFRQLHRRHAPAALQHQQHVEHPCRTHTKTVGET